MRRLLESELTASITFKPHFVRASHLVSRVPHDASVQAEFMRTDRRGEMPESLTLWVFSPAYSSPTGTNSNDQPTLDRGGIFLLKSDMGVLGEHRLTS
jgi:hypothetical protein